MSDNTSQTATDLIDTHCHLDFAAFDDDRNAVIRRALQQGISHIIIPGTQRVHWPRISRLCDASINCLPCYGLHPYWADEHLASDIDALRCYIETHPVIAIGECGLDYRPGQADKKTQRHLFEAQLEIAAEKALPVVIHSVRATQDVIDSIKNIDSNKNLKGMIHSFSGSLEQARQLMELNFYISIGGSASYDNAKKIRRVISGLPLEALLLETDAPDQITKQHERCKRNEPAFMLDTLQTIAQLREESLHQIACQTTHNARTLFSIPA